MEREEKNYEGGSKSFTEMLTMLKPDIKLGSSFRGIIFYKNKDTATNNAIIFKNATP